MIGAGYILFLGVLLPITSVFSGDFTPSGPLSITTDHTVIENLHITANGIHGIRVNGAADVTIRNCRIDYTGSCNGILFSNADRLVIDSCAVTCADAPDTGALPDAERTCIVGQWSDSVVIKYVRLTDGSSGIYLLYCDEILLQYIEGHDFRGPFPRGQLVQWDKCRSGILEDFSVINDREIAWTEDNINCYRSGGQIIRRGLIQGNNSPSGVGVLFEDQEYPDAVEVKGGLVEDVDLVEMGNGVCTGADSAHDITFRRIRARDNICGDLGQGRGTPSSNALVFSGYNGGYNLTVENAVLYNLCNPGNLFWPAASFLSMDYTMADFTPRAAVELVFSWEGTGISNEPVLFPQGTDAVPVICSLDGRMVTGSRVRPGVYIMLQNGRLVKTVVFR